MLVLVFKLVHVRAPVGLAFKHRLCIQLELELELEPRAKHHGNEAFLEHAGYLMARKFHETFGHFMSFRSLL